MPDAYEIARLQAVVAAVTAELAKPGVVTRARLAAALAVKPPTPPPLPPVVVDHVADLVEETV